MANTKVTGDLIASLTIATGNIANNAITSDKISGLTTAHITEGANLYYTDARARAAVSVSGNALSYNSSTGVITSNFEESPTFTGNVTLSSTSPILYLANTTATTGKTWRLSSAANGNAYITQDGVIDAITLSHTTGNATFAGRINGVVGGTAYNTAGLWLQGNSSTDGISIGGTGGGDKNIDTYGGALNLQETSQNGVNMWGNVGIGGTPSRKLDVRDSSNTQNTILAYNQGASFTGTVYEAITDRTANAAFNLMNLKASTSSKFLVRGDGNVGIGTTSPYGELSIKSASPQVYLETTSNGNVQINFNENADQLDIMVNNSVGKIAFGTNSTERMRIDSSGVISIGPSTTSSEIYFNYNNTNNKGGLKIDYSTGELRLSAGESGNGYHQAFYTNGTEKMRIDSSGNVTIGSSTLTGSRSLTLLSATNATNYDINFQQAGTTNFGRIRFTEGAADFQFFAQVGQDPNLTLQYGGNSFFSRGNVGIGTTSPNTGKLVVEGVPYVVTNSGQAIGGIDIRSNASGANTYSGAISFGGTASGRAAIAGVQESSDADTQGLAFFTHGSGTGSADADERMRISRDGNVGIGPQSNGTLNNKLQVSSSVDGDGIILTGQGDNTGIAAGSYRRIGFRYDDTDESFESEIRFVVTNSGAHGGQMEFFTDNTSGVKTRAITINNAQNVGIKTTAPSASLEVFSLSGGSNTLRLNTNFANGNTVDINPYISGINNGGMEIKLAGSQKLVMLPSGNVGIEETAPAEKLEVAGNIKAKDVDGKFYSTVASWVSVASKNDLFSYPGNGGALWEYVIKMNPNSAGSGLYSDNYYGKLGIGIGWNGSAVTQYIWQQQDQTAPRSLYPSGGGNFNPLFRMYYSGGIYTELAYGTAWTLRIQGLSTSTFGDIYFRRLA